MNAFFRWVLTSSLTVEEASPFGTLVFGFQLALEGLLASGILALGLDRTIVAQLGEITV
jgi:hypothetical protein